MAQNEKEVAENSLTVLSPANAALARQIVDEVFAVEIDESLPKIEAIFQDTLPKLAEAQQAELKPLLEALWGYYKGIELLRQGDFSKTSEIFQEAAKKFDALGFYDLRDLSVGMGVYVNAALMLQQMNVGQALEYFAKVKTYLEGAGKFSSRFRSLIDHMEPEALLTSGVQALMVLDLANGKVLLDKAAQASEKVAQKYYEAGSKFANTFNGLAQFYRAYFLMIQAMNNLNLFAFDKFQDDSSMVKTARSARELLSKADQDNQNVKNAYMLAQGVEAMLESVQELAGLMQKVFGATFKTDLKVLKHIRQNFEKGRDYFSQAGPQAIGLVRFSEQLSTQVNNLERLARPSKKDFGIFSGIISCALFLPIFLIVSWAKTRFKIDLEGSSLLWTCVGLALIGGFGFGAVKFKSFFSSGTGEKAEKSAAKTD